MSLSIIFILFNALVWGLSWWPLRVMQSLGVHPIWTTALMTVVTALGISLLYPRVVMPMLRSWPLWTVALSSGACNLAFNWGVTIGEVLRVVLMFYLMPLWSLLLARLILGEPMRAVALVSALLALTGAAIVLDPQTGGIPWPQTAADYLGVLGGFLFALNNILIRKNAHLPTVARSLAMFIGGVVISGFGALILSGQGVVAWPSAVGLAQGWPVLVATALAFLVANVCLQYSAARLAPHITALLLLIEVVVAAFSSVLWGGQEMSPHLWIGGACIIGATLLGILWQARH